MRYTVKIRGCMKMLVFVIDDEPASLETLRNAVGQALPGAEILDFRRGQEALEAVTEGGMHPTLVFTDIRMPDMNGLQLAQRLRAALPDARIVFVTAYSEYAMEAWRQHVHGFLLKPVTAEDVSDTLEALRLPTEDGPVQSPKLRVRCSAICAPRCTLTA